MLYKWVFWELVPLFKVLMHYEGVDLLKVKPATSESIKTASFVFISPLEVLAMP